MLCTDVLWSLVKLGGKGKLERQKLSVSLLSSEFSCAITVLIFCCLTSDLASGVSGLPRMQSFACLGVGCWSGEYPGSLRS